MLKGGGVLMMQLAYDTIFVGDATLDNVVTIKCILIICFELVSGLNVNFSKAN